MAKKTRNANSSVSASPYVAIEDRKSGPFDSYEVSEALRTLTKAEKIKRNKPLLRACRAEAAKQVQAAQQAAKSLQGAK